MESDELKVLWDFKIQCDHNIECRKPDIVVAKKEENKCLIVDIAVPDDKNVAVKEEKIQKYDELKWQIKELWTMKRVDAVLAVIGALSTVSKRLEKWIDRLGIKLNIEHLQTTLIQGTARILRKTLES